MNRGTWLNRDGYDSKQVFGSHDPVLWRIRLHEPASAALTFRDDVTGILYQSCRNETSDFLSIPRPFTLLVSREDCPRSAILHDSGYREGGLWVSRDNGLTWQFERLTRYQLDQLLWAGTRDEKLTPFKAWLVYVGVRCGGWVNWRRYRRVKP